MAVLSREFRKQSKAAHYDHTTIINELAALNQALDHLCSTADEFANLSAVKQVQYLVKDLSAELPAHFRLEETNVFATVREVSGELAAFTEDMTRQHRDLERRYTAFRATLEELERVEDLDDALGRMKEQGKELAIALERHIKLEETELGGFL